MMNPNRGFRAKRTPVTGEDQESRKAAFLLDMIIQDLRMTYPDLDYSITLLQPQAVKEEGPPSTDGMYFYYNPAWLVASYHTGEGKAAIRTFFLHILIHGLLGHFARHLEYTRRALVWKIMDMQVHKVMEGLDEIPDSLRPENKIDLPGVDDYGLYFKACRSRKLRDKMRVIAGTISLDDHHVWPDVRKRPSGSEEESGEGGSELHDGRSFTEAVVMRWEEAQKLLVGKDRDPSKMADKLVKVLIPGKRKGMQYGRSAGNSMVNFHPEGRSHMNYREGMREFLQLQEKAHETDTIDPILYEYGLELYGDMPLVEPSEISDERCLHSIVLAIDTSGSCVDAAGKFLAETNQLFEDVRNMGEMDTLHLLQCDTRIEDEQTFRGTQQLPKLSEQRMYGWGGTSFVPVFQKAEEYRAKGEEISLLIYLTDGAGEFPQKKPDYPVWFILPREEDFRLLQGARGQMVPNWVELLALE